MLRLFTYISIIFLTLQLSYIGMEKYEVIENFTSYRVSTEGNIESMITNKVLKPQKTGPRKNYLKVSLRKNLTTHQKSIHRLVATAFIPNPENKPTVNHLDGDTFNNAKSNLEWATYKEQEAHCKKLGLKKYNHNKGGDHVKAKEIMRISKEGTTTPYKSIMDAARELGVTNAGSISMVRCANNVKHYKTAYGYKWEWVA